MTASYSPRQRLFEGLIVVEGITRSGKFLLASVLSALEGVEPVQYAPSLENLLMFHRVGTMDLETARVLLHMEFDLRTYEMAVGRYLNTRSFDISCVSRVPEADKILARAQTEDRDALIRRFLAEKRVPLHIYHEGLPNARALFDVFPETRLISVIRDPASLMVSWRNRGWGKMPSAEDRRVMWPFFQSRGKPCPWWALGWDEDYISLSETDRCVLNIASLYAHARRELEEGGPELARRICFVRFEDALRDPRPVLRKLSAFLGREALPGMPAVLERERLPRKVAPDERARQIAALEPQMSPRLRPILEKACADYDVYWTALAA